MFFLLIDTATPQSYTYWYTLSLRGALPISEGGDAVGQRGLEAMRGRVEQERPRLPGQGCQPRAARAGFRRQEPFEHEPVARQPRHAQRGDQRAGEIGRAHV